MFQGSRSMAEGSCFMVQGVGSGFMCHGSGSRAQGSGFRVQGLGTPEYSPAGTQGFLLLLHYYSPA